jgi:hypothetical protein
MAGRGSETVKDKEVATTGPHHLIAVTAGAPNLDKGKSSGSSASASSARAESVADMMRKLNLTPREAEPFVLEDEGASDLPCPEWALVGKVMAPNTLHVQTITAVLRPAWGNPKGMKVRPLGPNLFLAEFSSEADRLQVLKGGPWTLSKHAILLKKFDSNIEPTDVIFDQLYIWARIMRLGFNLMNSERGGPIAGRLGEVDKLDVDENGRAWGSFLRARVMINPTEPVMRCISVFSKSKQETVFFDVMYEKLPMFCFSCGLIGHSSLVCPNPAERDEEGKLPWHGDRLCVPDVRKRDTVTDHSSKSSWSGTDQSSATQSAASAHGKKKGAGGSGEVNYQVKKPARGQTTPAAKGNDTELGMGRHQQDNS